MEYAVGQKKISRFLHEFLRSQYKKHGKSCPFCIHNAIMLMFAEGRGRTTQPQRHFRKELVTLLQGRIARVPGP